MSLITPEIGLLFWMVVIFALVFFILAKFGFPVITNMIDKRNEHIENSLEAAHKAELKLEKLAQEQEQMIQQTRLEQGRIIKEANETRDRIVAQAKEQAQQEASKIVSLARQQIDSEKQEAVREIRSQVAALSVEVAEKIVRKDLSADNAQAALAQRMLDEASNATLS